LLTAKNIVIEGKFKTDLKAVELSDLRGTQIVRKAVDITEPKLMDM
jgi:hypothetical protein